MYVRTVNASISLARKNQGQMQCRGTPLATLGLNQHQFFHAEGGNAITSMHIHASLQDTTTCLSHLQDFQVGHQDMSYPMTTWFRNVSNVENIRNNTSKVPAWRLDHSYFLFRSTCRMAFWTQTKLDEAELSSQLVEVPPLGPMTCAAGVSPDLLPEVLEGPGCQMSMEEIAHIAP